MTSNLRSRRWPPRLARCLSWSQVRPRAHDSVFGSEHAAVLGAQLQPTDRKAGFLVDEEHMGFVRREEERFTPLPQSDEKGKQAAPFLGQHIFLVRAAIRGGNQIHNPMFDEIMEPRRQDVLGEPKAPSKFTEPPRAIERLADD